MPRQDTDRFQKAAARLISNPNMADTLDDLDQNPEARGEAKRNPKAYLRGKGLDVPDDMEVTFTEGSFSIRICGWGYCITLESQ